MLILRPTFLYSSGASSLGLYRLSYIKNRLLDATMPSFLHLPSAILLLYTIIWASKSISYTCFSNQSTCCTLVFYQWFDIAVLMVADQCMLWWNLPITYMCLWFGWGTMPSFLHLPSAILLLYTIISASKSISYTCFSNQSTCCTLVFYQWFDIAVLMVADQCMLWWNLPIAYMCLWFGWGTGESSQWLRPQTAPPFSSVLFWPLLNKAI